MEEVKEQDMEQVTSLGKLKEKVDKEVERKGKFLDSRKQELLKSVDLNDNKKMTDAYNEAVSRNSEAIDFIMDLKNDILRFRLIKDKLDPKSAVYTQQCAKIDYFIKILNDVLSIIQDERSKMDRIVRYYERNFVVYKDY